MKFSDPDSMVTCPLCDHSTTLDKCTTSESGAIECPACGGHIQPGEGDLEPTEKPPEKPHKPIPFQPMSESRAHAVLGRAWEPKVETEPPPKAFCSVCGAEWSMVKGKPWPNCGHTAEPTDDPNKAKRYNPPAGAAVAALQGRTLNVTRGKHTFPTVAYGSIHVGPFSVSVETTPDMNLVEVARKIRADLRTIANEAYEEEMEWYEEKIRKLKGE